MFRDRLLWSLSQGGHAVQHSALHRSNSAGRCAGATRVRYLLEEKERVRGVDAIRDIHPFLHAHTHESHHRQNVGESMRGGDIFMSVLILIVQC